MAEDFNVHECSKYLEEELTNIALLPRPHLGVLGTIFEDKFGLVSDERSGIEEEAEAIGIEVLPTLAEVEEKYRFIPNRCKINLVLKPKSSDSTATIDIIYFYRKKHSDKLPENDLDPDPQNNFEREKIHLIIPVTFPFPNKVKVGSDEIETKMSNDLCTFIYEWKSKSMPYRIKEGEADIALEHTYGLRIRGLLQKLVAADIRLHLELENTSDESKAAFVLDPLSKKDKPLYNYGYLFDFKIVIEMSNAVIT